MRFFSRAKKIVDKKFNQAGLRENIITLDNLTIHYWDNKIEQKPTIVLVHGFGASGAFQWFKQIKTLSKNHRVVMVNLLYFGQSIAENKYEVEDQVHMIAALLEYLKIKTIKIAGISYGGLVSTEFCATYPNKVDELILIDAAVKYLKQEMLNALCTKYDVDSIADFFVPPHYKGLKKQLRAAYYKRRFIPNFILKSMYKDLILPHFDHWRKIVSHLENRQNHFNNREYTIDCPVQLYWGEYDEITPIEIAHKLKIDWPQAQLNILPNTKHLPNIEQAARFNKIIYKALGQ